MSELDKQAESAISRLAEIRDSLKGLKAESKGLEAFSC